PKPELGKLKPLPPRKRMESDFALRTREAGVEPRPEASLWNVPHERNPVFTGRSETLDKLRADLLRDGRQALYGLGGIGKTQIAAEYAFRHRQNHNAIFWVFADSEQSIGIDYVRIAKLLNL